MVRKFNTQRLFQQLDEQSEEEDYWISFLENDNLEAGVMKLLPGQPDHQEPHSSEEIYFILSGNGHLTIDGKKHRISAGTAFHIPKNTSHKFHGNSKPIVAYYALG